MNVRPKISLSTAGLLAVITLISACNEPAVESTDVEATNPDTPAASSSEEDAVVLDPSALFLEEGLISDIFEEPCTLSGGTETTCYRITVTSIPTDHPAGPWCPETITDTAEAGGIWPENGEVNDVDGPFVENWSLDKLCSSCSKN